MSQTAIHRKPIDWHRHGRAVWRWLRRLRRPVVCDTCESGHRDVLPVTAPPLVPVADRAAPGGLVSAGLVGDGNGPAAGATVLLFPIHGEALLVRLAEVLRRRVDDMKLGCDPLLLQIARSSRTRLSIDPTAYVEFMPECAEFRAVLEAQHGIRVILETADFDALVDFVVPYVGLRLAECDLEAAS